MVWKAGESGNPDGSRKEFLATVKRAIAQDDAIRLRKCVEKVLDLAADGERWAVELLRDTLDGKPAQSIVATDEEGRSLAVALIQYSPTVVEGEHNRVLPSLQGKVSGESKTVQ